MASPEITDDMRARARSRPGARLYVTDSEFDARGEVPPWGIRGAFETDPTTGTIGNWVANPNYRPGPKMRGWPDPTNAVERALELAASGYGPGTGIAAALATASAHVVVVTDHAAPDQLPVSTDTNGRRALYAYTSPHRVPPHVTAPRVTIAMRSLAKLLDQPDMHLALNTDSAPGIVLSGRDLLTAMITARRREINEGA
ncbi:SseB protein N-terminal domain-containing protein [Saccharopolyspora antimicrobica]|uniref:SseB protein N-terminal domain-containing protein n=1 Tax=Saccharopolyspora antimicrobica TaxID=455193 RepID=A0A1I4Q9X5_9PSEU|nr:type VII secretion system-associated protein [Saccharopolyspora antimicrobica]RKT84828.1 type III secretion system (T3SS) SseB-like protein [Saccharopolyspora antimicrobica]SFM36596.1 SseB protein N-terminal domain-containing protein [Saccharopolyspora antimicrobica]